LCAHHPVFVVDAPEPVDTLIDIPSSPGVFKSITSLLKPIDGLLNLIVRYGPTAPRCYNLRELGQYFLIALVDALRPELRSREVVL
jgi:hypothetical protein